MLARVKTNTIIGINSIPIDVEVKTKNGGTTSFVLIGLGDVAVRESRDRVLSALRLSGFDTPDQILINLAPAEIKKTGSSYDLAIAIGILVSSGQLSPDVLYNRSFLGELSLDGKLKAVRGVVVTALDCLRQEIKELIVPYDNLNEAKLIAKIATKGAVTLVDVVGYLTGKAELFSCLQSRSIQPKVESLSIDDVKGQDMAKRALIVAATGGHNVLMIGPPGCGKSMLAKRFLNLLPPLQRDEAIDIVKIHSVLGLPIDSLLEGKRPYRDPHHGASVAGIVGGGSPPRPGEISLAHNGVLFFDELPEFAKATLEALRAPLEEGIIRIVRAKDSFVFPSRFQFIAAMNPCPCGRYASGTNDCNCSINAISNYVNKISQPILDRIDIHLELNSVPVKEIILNEKINESINIANISGKILDLRQKQIERQKKLNAFLDSREVVQSVKLDTRCTDLIEKVATKFSITARGCIKVLKMARTIADLSDSGDVRYEHLTEALGYRKIEKYIKRLSG